MKRFKNILALGLSVGIALGSAVPAHAQSGTATADYTAVDSIVGAASILSTKTGLAGVAGVALMLTLAAITMARKGLFRSAGR